MSVRNDQTIVASTNKAINKARVNGKLQLDSIAVYQLLDYYINFTQQTIDNGSSLYVDANNCLTEAIRNYTYDNSDTLCNYKITTSLNKTSATDPSTQNTAPTVSGITIDLEDNNSYNFKVADFTTNYFDAENDSYKNILLYLDDTEGTFTYNEIEVTGTLQISVTNVVNLKYTRPDDAILAETLNFRISDNNVNSLFSSVTINSLTGIAVEENLPPVVGDNTVYVDNRVATILTLEMFTSELAPPYNDPEGDLIDAIRIDEISEANQGTFYINGIEVQEGDIITRENLEAELFTHIGADADTISSDVINFSARDEGSQIWVQ